MARINPFVMSVFEIESDWGIVLNTSEVTLEKKFITKTENSPFKEIDFQCLFEGGISIVMDFSASYGEQAASYFASRGCVIVNGVCREKESVAKLYDILIRDNVFPKNSLRGIDKSIASNNWRKYISVRNFQFSWLEEQARWNEFIDSI